MKTAAMPRRHLNTNYWGEKILNGDVNDIWTVSIQTIKLNHAQFVTLIINYKNNVIVQLSASYFP